MARRGDRRRWRWRVLRRDLQRGSGRGAGEAVRGPVADEYGLGGESEAAPLVPAAVRWATLRDPFQTSTSTPWNLPYAEAIASASLSNSTIAGGLRYALHWLAGKSDKTSARHAPWLILILRKHTAPL